jgi:tetratricopeptide (TPR) repeat protein
MITMLIQHRRLGLKSLVLAVCIGGAFVTARMPKSCSKNEAPRKSTFRTPSPTTLLDFISIKANQSPAEWTVTRAVEKARAAQLRPESWVDLGDTLRQRMRDTNDPSHYDHAELAYRQALRLEPASADAMNGMAWLTGGRHHFDQSIDWAKQALAISPDSADAFGILGDAELELGNYDAAADCYQKMMDLRPDLASWSRGAWLLWINGEKGRAVSLMEKAIRAGGPYAENTAWCRARLATIWLHAGNPSAAAEALEPSLRERSRNPHVMLAAARIATAVNDHRTARQYYEKLLEISPSHDALVGLGDLCAAQGKTDEAETYYLKVEALHAAHQQQGFHSHLEMARFLADHDRDPVAALRLAEQHKLTRNVVEADILAWVYLKNGYIDRAGETIKTALSRGTPDAGIHYHAGMIAAAAGDADAARKHIAKALEMNPFFHPLHAPAAQRMLAEISTSDHAADNQQANGTP